MSERSKQASKKGAKHGKQEKAYAPRPKGQEEQTGTISKERLLKLFHPVGREEALGLLKEPERGSIYLSSEVQPPVSQSGQRVDMSKC